MTQSSNTARALSSIAVYGAGLAAHMTVLALSRLLPERIALTHIQPKNAPESDAFYGTALSPEIYGFLEKTGLSEPDLLLKTHSSFSLGTHFKNWGPDQRDWVQSFHPPLPFVAGVDFHHFVVRAAINDPQIASLEPYLMPVQAARKGVFAHPPAEGKTPLSQMEYGYHFTPASLAEFFRQSRDETRVTTVHAALSGIEHSGDCITALQLDTGQSVRADLYVDCSGMAAALRPSPHPNTSKTSASNSSVPTRRLGVISSRLPSENLDGICRTLTMADYGWRAETPLQGQRHILTVFDPENEGAARTAHGGDNPAPIEVALGQSGPAWTDNCAAIGHAAFILEPLTPAPMMMMQRDILRLLDLIPVTQNCSVERREFNRRSADDIAHTEMFHRALFASESKQEAPYWAAAAAQPIDDKLDAKITQFQSRGVFAQFDYEPFSSQDWAMAHFGMGRVPRRYDPLADKVPEEQTHQSLSRMHQSLSAMAAKMPPHGTYLNGFINFLKKSNPQ